MVVSRRDELLWALCNRTLWSRDDVILAALLALLAREAEQGGDEGGRSACVRCGRETRVNGTCPSCYPGGDG